MKPTKALNIMFLMAVALHAIAELFPETGYRAFMSLSATPILLLLYVLSSKVKNILFITSIVLIYIGMFRYNLALRMMNTSGYAIWAIYLIIHIKIIVDNTNIFSIDRLLKFIIPFLLLFTIPTFFILKDVNYNTFLVALLFVCIIALFSATTIITYITKANKTTLLLLYSGIGLCTSVILGGVNGFVESNTILRAIEVTLFSLSHYFMYKYVIKNEALIS